MSNKRITIANFNIVFGMDEEPLLSYFDTIIMPAFYSGITRKSKDIEYEILKVKVIEVEEDNYALTGIIVKNTLLEVKSKFDENKNLIETDEVYATAPYSSFIIYLKNHRMILAKNQKGSPDLKSFSSTVRTILNKFILDKNKQLRSNGEKEILLPIINIVGIPMKNSINESLKGVEKINKLTLKFYPLNGDLDFSDIFEGMTTDLRKKVGSKTGSVVLNSPKSIEGVTEVITESQGTVEPIFNVTLLNGSKGTITNGNISESLEINIEADGIEKELEELAEKSKTFDSICRVSKGNEKIYNDKKIKILAFLKR